MLTTFAHISLLADPATKFEGWPPSSERLAATHREPDLPVRHDGILRLIDTHCGSPKDHYVNSAG